MKNPYDEFEKDGKQREDKTYEKLKEELRLLAMNLKKEALLDFITDECSKNPALMDAFLLRFVTEESQLPTFDYDLLIAQAAKRAETEWGSLEEYPILAVLEKLNLRALQQYHQKNFKDSLQVCKAIVLGIPPLLENLSGTAEIESAYFFTIDILRKLLIVHSGDAENSEAKSFAIQLLTDKSLEDAGYEDAIWEVILEAELNPEELSKLMAYIDTSISSIHFSPHDPEWEMTDWLLRKMALLKQDESIHDPLEAMEPFIEFTEIRDLFIERELKAGRTAEAKELIRAGIQKAEETEKEATIFQYENQLLEIAKEEGDQMAIRHLSGKLLLSGGHFNFAYYDLFKSTYIPFEWKATVAELIGRMGGIHGELSFSQASLIATILERENEDEQLLEMLSGNASSFELIQSFYHTLEEEYSVEIIQIFQLFIEEYAANHTGRPAYARLVLMLKTMNKVKGAAPFVRSVIRILKQRYPQRKAMIEILNQAFN